MLVEQISKAGNSMAPSVQAGIPADAGMVRNEKGGQEVQMPFQAPDSEQIKELAADVQKNLKIIHNVDLQFSVHEASGQIKVVVKDEASGKVIREIPPDEVLNLAAKFDEMVGLILDKQG